MPEKRRTSNRKKEKDKTRSTRTRETTTARTTCAYMQTDEKESVQERMQSKQKHEQTTQRRGRGKNPNFSGGVVLFPKESKSPDCKCTASNAGTPREIDIAHIKRKQYTAWTRIIRASHTQHKCKTRRKKDESVLFLLQFSHHSQTCLVSIDPLFVLCLSLQVLLDPCTSTSTHRGRRLKTVFVKAVSSAQKKRRKIKKETQNKKRRNKSKVYRPIWCLKRNFCLQT